MAAVPVSGPAFRGGGHRELVRDALIAVRCLLVSTKFALKFALVKSPVVSSFA